MPASRSPIRSLDTIVTAALALLVPAAVYAIGVRDLESYQHALFSLTSESPGRVSLLGVPVYEAGVGLGARLPLHGNFTAHPLAPLLAQLGPLVAYFALFALHLFIATRLVTAAARRLGGTSVWALLPAVLFAVSLPVVCYSLSNDWPETLTGLLGMAACVGGVLWLPAWSLRGYPTPFVAAAHALVGLAVPGLIAASGHPGYWPITTVAVGLALVVRNAAGTPSLRSLPGAVAFAMTGWLLPGLVALTTALDLGAEQLAAGPGAARRTQGPTDWTLDALTGTAGAGTRIAFAAPLLVVALLAVAVHASRRRVAVTLLLAWLASVALASTPVETPRWFLPSAIWNFRDPALLFALLAIPVIARHGRAARTLATVGALHVVVATVLAVAALDHDPSDAWTRDTRASSASVPDTLFEAGAKRGDRVLLSTEVANAMRGHIDGNGIYALSDLAGAGLHTVSAWTKARQLEWGLDSGEPYETWIVPDDDVVCSPQLLRVLGVTWVALDPAVAATTDCVRVLAVADRLPVDRLGVADAIVARLPDAPLLALTGTPRADDPDFRCPLLVTPGCVTPLGVASDGPPWVKDPSGAIRFTADRERWTLVPIDWDPGLRATTGDGGRLALVDHHGLAAVAPSSTGTVEVTVEWTPDGRATSRVASTLLALLVLLLAGPFAARAVASQRERQPPVAPL